VERRLSRRRAMQPRRSKAHSRKRMPRQRSTVRIRDAGRPLEPVAHGDGIDLAVQGKEHAGTRARHAAWDRYRHPPAACFTHSSAAATSGCCDSTTWLKGRSFHGNTCRPLPKDRGF